MQVQDFLCQATVPCLVSHKFALGVTCITPPKALHGV